MPMTEQSIELRLKDRKILVVDDDREVKDSMDQALQAEGKRGFEYKIYQDAPGGHSFNRLDTRLAKESRREIWAFLAPHLDPERPIRCRCFRASGPASDRPRQRGPRPPQKG